MEGTLVNMINGEWKAVEDLGPGDLLLGFVASIPTYMIVRHVACKRGHSGQELVTLEGGIVVTRDQYVRKRGELGWKQAGKIDGMPHHEYKGEHGLLYDLYLDSADPRAVPHCMWGDVAYNDPSHAIPYAHTPSTQRRMWRLPHQGR